MPKVVQATWGGDPAGPTRVSRRPCTYEAYVPDPLRDWDVPLPVTLAADMADAEQAVRQLNTDADVAHNLEPLARFLLRAEAVASSHIEGLVLNVRRLARSEADAREGWGSPDATATAVLGNIRALDRALDIASDPTTPVTVDSLREIHAALLVGTRDERWAGVIREEQNWIGGPNPCLAAFVPPPHEHVPALMEDLAAYISGDDHPAVLQAALAHSQFETIHPFADGNGRVGRALIQLVLRRRGLATRVIPPVSLILATRTDRYVDALMATRSLASGASGQLAWVDLFVESAIRACRDSVAFSEELAQLERDHRARLGKVRANSTVDLLVTALPALPVFTVKTAAALLERSTVAVSQAVTAMVDAGVVRQIKMGRRNRAFEAIGLFEAFTGFERMLASPLADTEMSPPARSVPERP